MSELTHIDAVGNAKMVDVGGKPATDRVAVAAGEVVMLRRTAELILAGNLKKGDVLGTARLAGIMAAKRTSELVPLCHAVACTQIEVEAEVDLALPGVRLKSTIRSKDRTGVEMEALTAVAVAALAVYDMAKSVERTMRISDIRLLEKRGGKTGDFLNG